MIPATNIVTVSPQRIRFWWLEDLILKFVQCFTSFPFGDWLKYLALLSQPVRGKTKTSCELLVRVSRAWLGLHVYALSADWFIGLSLNKDLLWLLLLHASVVIGRNGYFGFGFETSP